MIGMTWLTLATLAVAQDGGAQAPEASAPAASAPAAAPETPTPAPSPWAQVASAPVPVAVSEAELHQLEGASLYRVGLEHSARGDFEGACLTWLQVQAGYADTTWALRAWTQMEAVAKAAPESACAGSAVPRQVVTDQTRADDGRTELIITQAVAAPLVFGLFLPGAVGGTDAPIIPVSLAFVGLGAGIGGTWALTQDHPVTEGQAMVISAGELLGALNGGMLAGTLEANERGTFASLAAGTLLGGGLGLAVSQVTTPSAGEAALVRSGATWGGYFTAISFMIEEGNSRSDFLRVAGGVDLGTAAGIGLAKWSSARGKAIDRRRVNMVNLAGYTGVVVAGGVALVLQDYIWLSQEAGAAMLAGGALAGLGVGAVLTRDGAGPDLGTAQGVLLGHDSGGWSIGTPLPLVTKGRDGYRASLPLAAGTF